MGNGRGGESSTEGERCEEDKFGNGTSRKKCKWRENERGKSQTNRDRPTDRHIETQPGKQRHIQTNRDEYRQTETNTDELRQIETD